MWGKTTPPRPPLDPDRWNMPANQRPQGLSLQARFSTLNESTWVIACSRAWPRPRPAPASRRVAVTGFEPRPKPLVPSAACFLLRDGVSPSHIPAWAVGAGGANPVKQRRERCAVCAAHSRPPSSFPPLRSRSPGSLRGGTAGVLALSQPLSSPAT